MDAVFDRWCEKVVAVLKSGSVVESCDNDGAEESGVVSSSEDESDVDSSEIVDLEDIAGKAPSRRKVVANGEESNGKLNGSREMVTPVIRANLEKQAYNVIMLHGTLCNSCLICIS